MSSVIVDLYNVLAAGLPLRVSCCCSLCSRVNEVLRLASYSDSDGRDGGTHVQHSKVSANIQLKLKCYAFGQRVLGDDISKHFVNICYVRTCCVISR